MLSEYSVTSNTVKLLKHLENLDLLQRGIVQPIMVHVMPTHRCQLNCVHCCFKNRKNLKLDMDFGLLKNSLDQFYDLRVRAIELTGGGEPVLYPYISDFLEYAKKFHVGLITNGLNIERIAEYLADLSWVRLSLNPIDYGWNLMPAMKVLRASNVPVSFCYIWNQFSPKKIKEVGQFAEYHNIICRVSPDCINLSQTITTQSWEIEHYILNMKYLFGVKHKIRRKNNDCRIWMIKPALYTDGYIYPCPSAELAWENNYQINEKLRICHGSEVEKFYISSEPHKLECDCSFCKYAEQQEFLENLLMETDFNEFA